MKLQSVIAVLFVFNFKVEPIKYNLVVGHSAIGFTKVKIESNLQKQKAYIKVNRNVECYYFNSGNYFIVNLANNVNYFYLSDNEFDFNIRVDIYYPKKEEVASYNDKIYLSTILKSSSQEIKIYNLNNYVFIKNENDYLETNNYFFKFDDIFLIDCKVEGNFNVFLVIKKEEGFYGYLNYSYKYQGYIFRLDYQMEDYHLKLFLNNCFYQKGSFQLCDYPLKNFLKTNRLLLTNRITEINLIFIFESKIINIPYTIYSNKPLIDRNIAIIEE